MLQVAEAAAAGRGADTNEVKPQVAAADVVAKPFTHFGPLGQCIMQLSKKNVDRRKTETAGVRLSERGRLRQAKESSSRDCSTFGCVTQSQVDVRLSVCLIAVVCYS